jgi:hypothetical protein
MEPSQHHFSELFLQLGLPGDESSIRLFLTQYAPLAPDLALDEAPFWSSSQAVFLRESIAQDSDWAELVDQLSEALRAAPCRSR